MNFRKKRSDCFETIFGINDNFITDSCAHGLLGKRRGRRRQRYGQGRGIISANGASRNVYSIGYEFFFVREQTGKGNASFRKKTPSARALYMTEAFYRKQKILCWWASSFE